MGSERKAKVELPEENGGRKGGSIQCKWVWFKEEERPATRKICFNITQFIAYKVELANRAWISKPEKVLGAKKGLMECLETRCGCLHCSGLHLATEFSLQTGCGRSGGCSYPSELEGSHVGRKGQWRTIMLRKSTSGRSVGIYSFWCISQMKNSSLLWRCFKYVQNYTVACSQSETLEGYLHRWHWPRLGIREFRTSQVCRWRSRKPVLSCKVGT